MNEPQTRAKLSHRTPELPVEDVERAQQQYRDALGFTIGWLMPEGGIGAVSRDGFAIFFRRRERPFEAGVHGIFAPQLETKPWGLRQFTVEDRDGNRFYVRCD